MSSKPSKRVWPFGDQLRLEAAGAIARNRDIDLAILGQDRLRAGAVAAVAAAAAGRIALLVAEMLGQLGPKRTLDQRLLQLLEQPVLSGQIFGLLIVSKQLIQKFRCNRRISRHVSLLVKGKLTETYLHILSDTLLFAEL